MCYNPLKSTQINSKTLHNNDAVKVSPASKPLHISFIEAAANGNTARIMAMIEKGVNIDSTDRTGRTALHLASSEGHTLVVCILIRNGANPNIRDNLGNEPLCEAIIKGHTKTSDELVLGGARLSETAQAALDMKFRHLAAAGDLGGIKMLAETGLAIDAVDSVGRSALHIATERGHEHVVEYLLARGADVRRRDQAGDTALSLASRHNLSSIQEALLSCGANGATPGRRASDGDLYAATAVTPGGGRPWSRRAA